MVVSSAKAVFKIEYYTGTVTWELMTPNNYRLDSIYYDNQNYLLFLGGSGFANGKNVPKHYVLSAHTGSNIDITTYSVLRNDNEISLMPLHFDNVNSILFGCVQAVYSYKGQRGNGFFEAVILEIGRNN